MNARSSEQPVHVFVLSPPKPCVFPITVGEDHVVVAFMPVVEVVRS